MTAPVVSITESQMLTALRTALLAIMPVGTEIIKGQGNRVPEPGAGNFVTMTPWLRERLEWNTDTYSDIETIGFTILNGAPQIGDTLVNSTLTASATVLSVDPITITLTAGAGTFATLDGVVNQTTGLPVGLVASVSVTGGVETIVVEALSSIPSVADILTNITASANGTVLTVSGTNVVLTPGAGGYFAIGDIVTDSTTGALIGTTTAVSYGGNAILQPTQITTQLNVHGLNGANNAQVITSVFRDQYGVDLFNLSGLDISPLYASDPRQIPFVNAEQFTEYRWVVDVVVQCNIFVVVPVQFATSAVVGLVNVDVAYPA